MSYISTTAVSDSTKTNIADVTPDNKLVTKDKDALELLQQMLEVQKQTFELLQELMEKL